MAATTPRIDSLESPTGLSDVIATRLGLKSYSHGTTYNAGNAPTMSGPAGLAVQFSAFIPYQMQNGDWRMRLNFEMTYTSNSSPDITINGILGGANLPLHAYQAATGPAPWGRSNTGSALFTLRTSGATTGSFWSGDVPLQAKPTWAY